MHYRNAMHHRSLPFLSGLLACLACSPGPIEVDLEATIADEVEVLEGAELVFVSSDSDNISYASEWIDGNSREVVTLSEDERTGQGDTFAELGEARNFFAFLDLDGSESWDPGEPWGADPNNPVTFREGDDYYESMIVVETDPGAPRRRGP